MDANRLVKHRMSARYLAADAARGILCDIVSVLKRVHAGAEELFAFPRLRVVAQRAMTKNRATR